MNRFKVNKLKTKAAILYVIENLGEPDIHKVFKILYFADKEHLANYGRPITGDVYIAMKHGPVPSFIYDVIKARRGDGCYSEDFKEIFNAIDIISQYTVSAKEKSDLEELSKSDLDCLLKAIKENESINFSELTEKSHDKAWDASDRDDIIDTIEIAKAGGANKEMIKYIIETEENNRLVLR